MGRDAREECLAAVGREGGGGLGGPGPHEAATVDEVEPLAAAEAVEEGAGAIRPRSLGRQRVERHERVEREGGVVEVGAAAAVDVAAVRVGERLDERDDQAGGLVERAPGEPAHLQQL